MIPNARFALIVAVAVAVAISLVALRHAFVEARFFGDVAPDFTLTDQDGRLWTLSGERGREAVALFFGYTHCPDACPTTLATLARARRALGGRAPDLRIVFVTVDAKRDTAAVLKRYVALFDPSVVGLTGDAKATAPVYKAYHVWHQILPHSDSAAGYVAHSTLVYLIGRDGRLRDAASWSESAAEVVAKLKELLS